jgi:ketosteroid isomerase-like protein
MIRGLAEIREGMVRSREQTDVIFDDIGEPVIQRSGDLAVTYSTYAERRVSKATGEVTRQIGQWLLVWRRQADGIWRVSTETWTVEVPQ